MLTLLSWALYFAGWGLLVASAIGAFNRYTEEDHR